MRRSTSSPTVEGIREVIDEHGWWIGLIEESEDEPAFAYTIGLFEKLQHPEVIVVGLPLDVMKGVLNGCGALIREGARFEEGTVSNDVLEAFAVRFRAVRAPATYASYLGYGSAFYEGREFPVVQCVWPDKAGRFPGEDGVASFMLRTQPLLP